MSWIRTTFALKVWALLKASDLLLRGSKHLGRENSVHTTYDLPVAGDVVFGDELLGEIEGSKLYPRHQANNALHSIKLVSITVCKPRCFE